MLTHILVPLDGSRLAAQAVPYATALAHAFDARITLLAVIEPAPHRGPMPHPDATEIDARRIATSMAYLESMAAAIRAPDRTVIAAVRHGNPAPAIIAHAEAAGCDLIAMVSHGRTGLNRPRMGSVAQHVARHAGVPTLVVRATGETRPSADGVTITSVTVTLDGSALAEEALPLGTAIARRLAVPLTLLRVIPTHMQFVTTGWEGAYSDPATEETEGEAERDTAAYLDAIAAREPGSEIDIRTRWQRSPANEADEDLVACLARDPTGLAVVASHGRGGVLRWVLGSTAEYLVERGPCPILIVRAGHVQGAETDVARSEGGTIAMIAADSPDAPLSTDAQTELWSPRDIDAERSHPHPHPITLTPDV
jgi:nucleotide-binding universal stress UspA family protein